MFNRERLRRAGGFALFSALMLAGGQANAQAATTVEAAVQKLTGSTSREWIFQQVITKMGSGAECTQGNAYRFYSDHRLVIEKCENGRLVKTTHNWTIVQEGPLDIAITIDGTRYYLLFRDAGGAHLMRLQMRSSSKTQPTNEQEFRLSED